MYELDKSKDRVYRLSLGFPNYILSQLPNKPVKVRFSSHAIERMIERASFYFRPDNPLDISKYVVKRIIADENYVVKSLTLCKLTEDDLVVTLFLDIRSLTVVTMYFELLDNSIHWGSKLERKKLKKTLTN